MDDTEKSFSSFMPIRPSAILKISAPDTGEADENDMNTDKMGSKLQNLKKPSTKHFMSPTISAASKAVVPKRKILAERNEASTFSDTQVENSPKPDLTTIPVIPRIGRSSRSSSSQITPTPSYNSVSESDDDEHNTFVAHSSLKPYDPLTNYLSPRPKFLRYKPNRRRDTFLGRKSETGEEKDGFGVGKSVLFDSQKAMDEEELLGDPGSSSASSSLEGSVKQEEERINKSDGFDSDEEMEEFEEKGGLLKGVLKFFLVFVVLFLSTLYISSMNSPTPSPTLQVIWGLKDDYFKIQNHIFEAVTMKVLEVGSESLDPNKKTQVGSMEAVNQRYNTDGIESLKMVQDDYSRGLLESTNDDLVEVVELQNAQIEDVWDGELDKTEEKASDWFKGTEIVETEVEYDHELEDQAPSNSGYEQVEIEDQVEPVDGIISDVAVGKEVVEDVLKRVEDFTDTASEKIVILERVDSETTKSDATNPEVEYHTDHLKTVLFPEAVIGFSIFFMIVASLVLGFHLRRKRTSAKNALAMGRMLSESVITDKISPVLPPHMEEEVVPFVNPSSLICSTEEESSKEFYQSRAPTVELLGELEVGEISSSLKSCGMKSRMMENEESNYSIFQEEGTLSKAAHVVVSSQLQPSLSEFSTMNSPSNGSFTAEKKMIVKKEEGRDGEVRMAVTTPVRRSTRIRNRSVMSP